MDSKEHTESTSVRASLESDNDASDRAPEVEESIRFGSNPLLSGVIEEAETDYLYSDLKATEELPEGEDELPLPKKGDSNSDNDNHNGDDGNDGADVDDAFDFEDSAPRNWRPWLYTAIALILIAGVAALVYFWPSLFGDDEDDSVTEVPVALSEDSGLCRATDSVDLNEVGVLNYGDSLVYNTINPFWTTDEASNGDAQAILDGAVTELFKTVGDGCTPSGTAYWRNVLPHSIDADRVGVDNYDAATRTAIYAEDMDTKVAVASEIVRQLANCADVHFVNLTVEEVPMIYVAAYTADYNDVVFVQTPLLQLDTLPNDEQGLIVIRCSFGKMEGNNGGYANDILVSPSLRAIVYLDSPTGTQIFRVEPDTDESEQTQDQPDQLVDAAVQEAPKPTDTDARPTEQQAAEIVDDASQTRDVAPVSIPETDNVQVQTTDDGAQASVTPQTAESEADEQKRTTPEPVDEPVSVSTEEEDAAPTSQEVATTPEDANQGEPEKTATQKPVSVSTEEEDSVSTSEQVATTPEDANQGEPEETASVATTTTTGLTDDQADNQKPNDGSGEGCDGTCGEDGNGSSGTGGDKGTTTSGDDCSGSSCPGDGPGDDCFGSSCPGDGPGDGPGDDPGDEPIDEPPCPPGWILDPFGNCKAPDPGPEGF